MKVLFLVLLLVVFPSQLLADEKGYILRTVKLYKNPVGSSKVIGQLKSGARVDIIDTKSGWRLVFHPDKTLTGWVRQYQLRTGTAAEFEKAEKESDSGGFLSGLLSITRRVTGFLNTENGTANNTATLGVRGRPATATLGVRGLSESQLQAAKPNIEELRKMKQYASSMSRIDSFVSKGKLRVKNVKLLN